MVMFIAYRAITGVRDKLTPVLINAVPWRNVNIDLDVKEDEI